MSALTILMIAPLVAVLLLVAGALFGGFLAEKVNAWRVSRRVARADRERVERLRRGGLGLVACLLLAGCPSPKTPDQVDACRREARADFHKRADECDTEACIDAQSERETVELKECR